MKCATIGDMVKISNNIENKIINSYETLFNSSKIDHYPSNFKKYLLYNKENFNFNELSIICTDIGCEKCCEDNKCKICKLGYFLYQGKCYTICPKNYVADIFKRICVPLDSNNSLKQISYLKAFSTGSCYNICGKNGIDCSCLPTCSSEGNCCSDYHICEKLININTSKRAECFSGNNKCDLCENLNKSPDLSDPSKIIPYKCGQCKDGLLLREGECVTSCFATDSIKKSNNICIPKEFCLVENCSKCLQTNSSVCKTCTNGYFMYDNQCLLTCPPRLRADRISWSCIEPPIFAWYWIFPSKSSCRNRCGRHIDYEMDCSCDKNCFRNGDCCQDIEESCSQFVYWK